MYLEKLFRAFFSPHFWSRYSCEYKKVLSHLFPTIFFPNIFFAEFVCIWKNCFARFFPHFIWSRYSCEYKKPFRTYFRRFFSQHFFRRIRVYLEKLIRPFFSPPFFGHHIRVNIKKFFRTFFRRCTTAYSVYFPAMIHMCKIIFYIRPLHGDLLIPWSRVLLEKLPCSQLDKIFPAFHGTRKFITTFTNARHLPLS